MKDNISERIKEHNKMIDEMLSEETVNRIELISKKTIESYKKGGKLVIFGNGGSASDAQHIVAELVNKFQIDDRPMLNALALNINASIITAIANDISYDDVFARQVEHLVDYRDVVIGISTSGKSRNVIKALQTARNKGALTVGFTGRNGGEMKDCVDILLNIPSDSTPRIQEAHILAGHIICELIEYELFGK